MFGMSFAEILIIAVIAILFLGPEKLPEAMIKVAKFFKSFTRTINEAKNTIEEQVHLEELKNEGITYANKLTSLEIVEEEKSFDKEDKPKKKKKKRKKKKEKKDA